MATPPAPARTLATDLRERDDDALIALLRARPDLAAPLPGDLAGLAARASTRTSVLRAVDRLDAAGWHVLQGLLVLDEPASFAELRTLLGEPDESELRPVIDRLRSWALAWGSDVALWVPARLRELGGEFPAGLGPPVYPLLLGGRPETVAAVVTTLGLEASGDVSQDAAVVSRALGTPATLVRLLAEVDEPARRALAQMTWGPPLGRVPDAERRLGPVESHGTIDQLLARGLLVPAGGDRVLLPREVGLHLRGGRVTDSMSLAPPPLACAAREPALVDRTAAGAAAAFVAHVTSLLDRWSAVPPSELRAGGLAVRDVRAGSQALALDETETAFVAEVAYAAGLVASSDDADPVWAPTPDYDRWRATDTAEQWALLALAWLTSNRAAGLAGGRDDRDRRLAPLGPDLTQGSVAFVRLDVLTTMAGEPPGSAPTLESLQSAVEWCAPRRAGGLQRTLGQWTVREAAQLGVTGMGALADHGRSLLSDAGTRQPAVTALRAPGARLALSAPAHTAAAAALAPLLPAPVDYVLLQADLTAIAPGPLLPELASALATAADVESTGGATVYRFTAGSLRRAFDAGRSAEDLHRMLEGASRTPVPQPLHYLVDDVARRHGRVRVSVVQSVIRVDDEAAADLLLGDRNLAVLGLRRLASTVLSSERAAQTVVEVMRNGGHSPVVEGHGGELLVRAKEVRRAPSTRRAHRIRSELAAAAPAVLDAAVRSLRAGERVTSRGGGAGGNGTVRTALVARRPVDTLAVLQEALAGGRQIWIGYVDNNGTTSERLVDPVRVEGGLLTAYDHARDGVRTFAVHRVSGVALVDSVEQAASGPA
jgi:hypothetical protein